MAFERVYGPVGPERGDIQAAVIAATLANIHRDPKKHPEPYPPADFIPNWSGDVRWQDPDELEAVAKAAAMTIGEGDLT